MATTRKDLRGRTLRKGEMQRSSDKRYAYSYTDPLGRRKYIYANDLVTLREKEARLTKDQMDGLDIYVAGKATVNFVFDRYMSLKRIYARPPGATIFICMTASSAIPSARRKLQRFGIRMCCSSTITCWISRACRRTRSKAFIRCYIPPFSWRFGMRSSARIPQMV